MNTYGLKRETSKKSYFLFIFMFILLCVASIVTTQYIAYSYQYHSVLGKSFFGIYPPWKWVSWYMQFPDTYQIFDQATSLGVIIFILPVTLYIGFQINKKPRGNKNLHGSATWASLEEIKKTSLLNGKGVYLGGIETGKKTLSYLRHDGAEHILVYAPTRSGKGIGIVVPTLLSWNESALILDIKGENWALSAGYRKSIGHSVFRFDPTDYSGNSARFNPLDEIRLGSPKAIPDTQNIATMIVDPDSQGLKDYWQKSSFSFLSGLILHCLIVTKFKHQRNATMEDLAFMLSDPERELSLLFDEMLDTPHKELLLEFFEISASYAESTERFIKSTAMEMKQREKAQQELSGVVNSVLTNLTLYRDPVIAQNLAESDFSINDIMNFDKPVSVYLVISPNDIDRIRPLIRLIMNLIMRRLVEKMEFDQGRAVKNYKFRLLLLLDEFTSLGKLEIFEKALAYMASYGVKAVIIIQDIPQLHKEYSKNESIMSNCHIKVAYATNNIETAKQVSEMVGKTTVVEQKTSLSGSRAGMLKNANVSISETARSLLTPDEISRLPGLQKDGDQVFAAGDVLIFVAGFLPIYGKQMPFFFNPIFQTRSAINPPIKSDSIKSIEKKNEKIQANITGSNIDTDTKHVISFSKHFGK